MKYGLIGKTLKHSFSKEIHEKIGDYEYELCPMDESELAKFFTEKNFLGVNVTIPYKKAVIPYLDYVSDGAKKIGAVNTVVNVNGVLKGYNTDYFGAKELIDKAGVSVKGKTALILGTGGTSDTLNAVLTDLGAKTVLKVSRTPSAGQISYDLAVKDYNFADIIVNTTPKGMYPYTDETPIDLNAFNNLSGVIDVIYNPLNTRLILAAKEKGIPAAGGLYMLASQAVHAYGLFSRSTVTQELTEKVYRLVKCEKQNVVLTGMPSSGKTTIGKLIAKKLGRPFYDTDDLIEERAGEKIPKIFEEKGEKYFRLLETEAIKSVSDKTGAVIATGGGAPTVKENVTELKKNGKIIFIDRSPDKLTPTDGRPLSRDIESLKKRYQERYPVYLATADAVIKNDESVYAAIDKILKEAEK